MPEIFKASEQNLDKVFCNDFLFEIPVYQRPYAWTRDNVDELLDDLLFAMDREAIHFLGSIVLIKGDNADSQVVDGQQRLTTLTMLLCTLRELTDGEVKAALDQRIRQQRDVLSGAREVVRLTLRNLDKDFFYSNVQAGSGLTNLLGQVPPERKTDSQQRIFENVEYLYKKLLELGTQRCQELAKFVIQNCYLVVVSTPDISSAYRIFSVMNDRGLDLSATDILKAEVIGVIPDEDQRAYGDKWEGIEQELGRGNFGALFAHIRMIYEEAKLRVNLQDEFKDKVLKKDTGTNFIDNVLEPYADTYKTVLGMSDDNAGDNQNIDRYLQHLHRLDNADWIPPALSFLHHRNQYKQNQLVRFMKDLERLAYGLFIQRANINVRINRYAEVLRAIKQGDAIWQDDGPLQLRDDEKEAILWALDGPVYTLPRVPGPLLLRLDSLLADTGAIYQYSTISIEHVLPQHPAANSEWCEQFSDEERSHWTHRLANLVLLSFRKNVRASNWGFERKKKEYFQKSNVAPFALTTKVVNESEWTPEVLRRRQQELINKLKEEWRLN